MTKLPLPTTLEEAHDEIRALRVRVMEALQAIADLQEQVRKNSRNSSKPPSTDKAKAARKKKTPSGKKQGAQPGHKKAERQQAPPELVRCAYDHRPTQCEGCRAALSGQVPDPRRHQIYHLPRIQP